MKLVLQLEEGEQGAATADLLVHLWNEQLQLFLKKNAAYGDAWRRQGWMGNLARIMSKGDRLRNMLWRNVRYNSFDSEEPVEDTLRDLAMLCMFMLINRNMDNQWGERS